MSVEQNFLQVFSKIKATPVYRRKGKNLNFIFIDSKFSQVPQPPDSIFMASKTPQQMIEQITLNNPKYIFFETTRIDDVQTIIQQLKKDWSFIFWLDLQHLIIKDTESWLKSFEGWCDEENIQIMVLTSHSEPYSFNNVVKIIKNQISAKRGPDSRFVVEANTKSLVT